MFQAEVNSDQFQYYVYRVTRVSPLNQQRPGAPFRTACCWKVCWASGIPDVNMEGDLVKEQLRQSVPRNCRIASSPAPWGGQDLPDEMEELPSSIAIIVYWCFCGCNSPRTHPPGLVQPAMLRLIQAPRLPPPPQPAPPVVAPPAQPVVAPPAQPVGGNARGG